MLSKPYVISFQRVLQGMISRYSFGSEAKYLQIQPGIVYDQKGSQIFFGSLMGLHLNKPVFVDQKQIAIVTAVLERYSIALLLEDAQSLQGSQVTLSQKSQLFIRDQKKNQIKIQDLIVNDSAEDLPLKSKKYRSHRICSQKQIFSGDFLMDLFYPLCEGQFILLENENLIRQISQQFDRVILCGRNQSRLLKSDKFVFFQEENSTASQLLIPQAALTYAQNESQKHKTLLIYTDLYEHTRAYNQIQDTMFEEVYGSEARRGRIIQSPTLLGNIAESCGFRKNESNLTVVLVQKEKDDHDESTSVILKKDLESMASQILPNRIEKTPPPSAMNLKYQWPILFMVAENMHHILTEHNNQKHQLDERQKLQMHIEPWDYYTYLDGKVWYKMIELLNSKGYEPIDIVILSWWICKVVENDQASQLKDEPQQILDSLLDFSSQMKEFDKKSFRESFYFYQESMKNSKEFALFISEHLNRLVELHLLHLKINNLLLPFKKDYMMD